MHPRRKGYSSLDELYLERDAVAWYWRAAALAASWLLLAGYLILPTTFDADPGLRFSKGGIDAIIAVCLTCGYALTVFLYFAVPSWLFQSDSVFYPALCSSAFGLIGTLYAFASSPRYKFGTAAGVAIALSSSSSAVCALLLVWLHRKIARVRVGVTTYEAGGGITVVEGPPQDGRVSQSSTAGLYQDPAYYRNYIANMHPSAIRAASLPDDRPARFNSLNERPSYQTLRDPSPSPPRGSNSYYDPPRNRSSPDIAAAAAHHPAQIGEDEQVSQHLARLLLNTRDGEQGPNASQATFRIDWRSEDDGDVSPAATAAAAAASPSSTPQGIQMRARTASGSRLVPPGKLAAQVQGQSPPPLVRLAPSRGHGELSRPRSRDAEGGRSASSGGDPAAGAGAGAGAGHRRARSRDDRRKEIELGFVGGTHPSETGAHGARH